MKQQFTAQLQQPQQTPYLTQEVPQEFSENMSNKELVLWLSHQPGTSYIPDVVEVIRGIVEITLYTSV